MSGRKFESGAAAVCLGLIGFISSFLGPLLFVFAFCIKKLKRIVFFACGAFGMLMIAIACFSVGFKIGDDALCNESSLLEAGVSASDLAKRLAQCVDGALVLRWSFIGAAIMYLISAIVALFVAMFAKFRATSSSA
ncbi:hypothetical protein BJ742DRAFT_275343 [Cladochytrium replicatum]|nr:hypothetical protein BJ742DRAFT_275343 [Cladochytrium replicatum]